MTRFAIIEFRQKSNFIPRVAVLGWLSTIGGFVPSKVVLRTVMVSDNLTPNPCFRARAGRGTGRFRRERAVLSPSPPFPWERGNREESFINAFNPLTSNYFP